MNGRLIWIDGVKKTHAHRAIKWLKIHHGILAWYREVNGEGKLYAEAKQEGDGLSVLLSSALEITKK